MHQHLISLPNINSPTPKSGPFKILKIWPYSPWEIRNRRDWHVYTMRRGLRRKQKPLILKLDDEWAWHRDACPPLLFQSGPLLLPSNICNSLCGGHRSNESKQNAGVGTGKVKEKWEEGVGKGKGQVSIIMHFHYLFLCPFPPLLLLSLVVFIYFFPFWQK